MLIDAITLDFHVAAIAAVPIYFSRRCHIFFMMLFLLR